MTSDETDQGNANSSDIKRGNRGAVERKRKRSERAALSLLLFALFFFPFSARALSFPEALTVIGEEAFRGNSSLTSVHIPESVVEIGEYAFADCENLHRVTIPSQVESIGAGAFDACGEALLLVTEPDCAGVWFARGNRIDYQADTHYRALVIAQTYSGTSRAIQGPANDQKAVRLCLSTFSTTPWIISARTNLTAAGITNQILSAFAGATENDVSLLYYSGHGQENGSLLGQDLRTLAPSALKECLDQIPGRKIIIVDACYSGQLIAEEETVLPAAAASAADSSSSASDGSPSAASLPSSVSSQASSGSASQFVQSFQAVFSGGGRTFRGALNDSGYYVITAARENQECEEGWITSGGSSRSMGVCTYSFCLGCGYDGVAYRAGSLGADRNGDNAVSIQEAYAYANNLASTYGDQEAMVWPSGCRWFAPFRP